MHRISGLSVALLLVLLVGLIPAQHTAARQSAAFPAVGRVVYCQQQAAYGDETVRSADYWLFDSDDDIYQDLYVVENLLDVRVCSRILIDRSREVVYHLEGDRQDFVGLDNFDYTSPCYEALVNDGLFGGVSGVPTVSFGAREVASGIQTTLAYPNELLLAPAFIGTFPQLVDVPLLPVEDRGFAAEIPLARLAAEQGIDITSGTIGDAQRDSLIGFYLSRLPGWELAPVTLALYPDNPYSLPLGRGLYVTIWKPDTQAVIYLEFVPVRRDELLYAVVKIPPTKFDTDSSGPALQGSSLTPAELNDLFTGWVGAEAGPTRSFLDGTVESYVLSSAQDAAHLWFLDVQRSGAGYDILYNRQVIQSACVPEEFMPSWARE